MTHAPELEEAEGFVPPPRQSSALSALVRRMRDYQFACDNRVEEGWKDWLTQLFVMATGSGKTICMASAAYRNYERGGRTLILCHMDELIEQARKKFTELTGLPTAKEKAKEKALLSDRVVVGSIQTLHKPNRLASWPKDHFSLVIGDEAHLHLAKGWMAVLSHFRDGGARILGCTATAERGDKQELGTFYQNLAFDYSLVRAVHEGWLVRPMVKTMNIGEGIDIRMVKASATPQGKDFNRDEVGQILEPLLAKIAADIYQEASERKVLVFMPSIDTSAKMAAALTAAGFKADYVSGTCPDRHQKIARYKNNVTRVLVNAQLLSTGWDCDDLDVIVTLRPTKISSFYRQMIGRGTRPLTSIVPRLQSAADAEGRKRIIAESGKPSLLILDPLWLYEKHDLTTPACLVAKNEDEEEAMKGMQGDLIANEEAVARDMLANIRKAVSKNRNRRASFIDPLSLAVAIGDGDLANYEPQTLWDLKDPTAEQLKALEAEGVETDKVRWRGQADRLLLVITGRKDRGLCSVRMMNWLKRRGIDATLMRHEDAVARQRKLFANGFRD